MAVTKNDIIRALANTTQHQARKEPVIDIQDWQRMIVQYPYCEIFVWHYLRALYRADDVSFDSELQRLGIRLGDRHGFYGFMTRRPAGKPLFTYHTESTDYFAAKGQEGISLTELARRLKEARVAEKQSRENSFCTVGQEKNDTLQSSAEVEKGLQNTSVEEKEPKNDVAKVSVNETDAIGDSTQKSNSLQVIRAQITSLIMQKKYLEALEILRRENFANSKKNAYFAVQIKYLETIINNK